MKTILITLAIGFLLTSCAHNFMRGTVAMKADEYTAHICLGKNDVKVGDKLDFYTNKCRGVAGRKSGDSGHCIMKILGPGTVTKLLNDHCSEVQTDGSFRFREGTLVQKQ